ncbi:MAG: helix-turn-helix domain-containing protein [Oscillospiraceae bacterium]
MPNFITLFADDDIAALLEEKFAEDDRFRTLFRAKNYSECLAPSVAKPADALILQKVSPVAYAQNLTYEMEMADYFPAVLMFERCENGLIRYVITDTELIPLSQELAEVFESAMAGHFSCDRSYYRTTVWNNNTADFTDSAGRSEALREILRGCSDQELNIHRETYNLDLKDSGYYLFFWQLNYVSYMEHRSYKDIYNFVGSVLREECRQVINSYNGGEVFYSRINQLCIFINDYPSHSEARRSTKFEEMLSQLATVTGAKKATRYLSRRVTDTGHFYLEYKRYLKERPNIFFMRDVSIMRSYTLVNRAPRPEYMDVNAILDKIINYIHYDIQNPDLVEEIRRLFFDIIKPSMDFPTYYYSVSVIGHALAKYGGPGELWDISDFLNQDFLQYSSLEALHAELIAMVKSKSAKAPYPRQSKSTLVMKTIDYISSNYSEKLSIADISRALYVSSTHLSQVFKNAVGVSLGQYLISYRIEQAKKILEKTDLMIYSVAEMVGFSDFRHFSKTFRKCVGVSPTQYRLEYNKKQSK